MASLSTKFSKFSWGGMPPDPPTWAAFGGTSAPHSKTTSFAYAFKNAEFKDDMGWD